MMRGYFFHPNYWGGGLDFFPMIFMIAFWILVILAIVSLLKSVTLRNNNDDNDENEDAIKTHKKDSKYLEIVKERYARGEINKKEFEQLKSDFS